MHRSCKGSAIAAEQVIAAMIAADAASLMIVIFSPS
jgi:hypothetical protein